MPSAPEVRGDLAGPARPLREDSPDAIESCETMQRAVMTDGALSAKVKELIALAIGAAKGCRGCVAAHGLGAVRQGATEAEVAEAMGVVILMNGGPGDRLGRPRAGASGGRCGWPYARPRGQRH